MDQTWRLTQLPFNWLTARRTDNENAENAAPKQAVSSSLVNSRL
jgi:hypothetical protein